MRIISGQARGTKLYTLDGMEITRPTLDRVKESIFNIIQNDIKNCVFVDLFAGSGAIGLEAASRGAKKVIMCDKSKNACDIIKKNIEKTHMKEKVKLYNSDYEIVLKQKIDDKIDIIYIDPPYETSLIKESLEILLKTNIITEESLIILETDNLKKIETEIENINVKIINNKKYGRANILFAKLNVIN